MPQTGTNGKRQGRDPALTWDIPEAVDFEEHALQAEACRWPLTGAGRAHVDAIVQQLLCAEGIAHASGWAPVAVQLAHEAADALSPTALAASGERELRRHIKVKRLVGGGSAEDSAVIQGVVCRKNVAHKRMRTFVEQPRIVALAGALEYQRSNNSLSSFDSLIEPEKEYLRRAIDGVVKLQPDVLLVERSVARYAQDLLLDAGVSLVLNVKPELLHRIAACTGGLVAASVEALHPDCVGKCQAFQVDSLPSAPSHPGDADSEPDTPPAAGEGGKAAEARTAVAAAAAAPKSLMMFRGCPHKLCATVLLHGGSASELAKVKRVVAFAAYAAYWNRLEAAFLSDHLPAAARCLGQVEVGSGAADVVHCSVARTAKQLGTAVIVSASPHISTYREPGLEYLRAAAELAGEVGSGQLPDRQSSSDSDAWVVAAESASATVTVSGADEPPGGDGASHVSSVTEEGIAAADPPEGHADLADSGAQPAGADIYDTQQLWLSISCRNPAKGILCEAPHPHSMPFYRETDLSLAAFIAAAAPVQRKCPHPSCGDGAALHLRSFLHGDGLVTLSSVRLPAGKELPDGDKGAVWLWVRSLGRGVDAASARRVSLSPEAASISFAHILALVIDARHLELAGSSLQCDCVRYLASGPTVLCLHYTRVTPYVMRLPPRTVQLLADAESSWLQEEIKAIAEEADEAFGAIQAVLQEQLPLLEGADPGAGSAWTDVFAETRSTFMEAVHATVALVDGKLASNESAALPNEGIVAVEAVRDLNRLRRVLAFIVQQWSESLAAGDKGSQPGPPGVLEAVQDEQRDRDEGLPSGAGARPALASSGTEEQPLLPQRTASGGIPMPTSYAAPKLHAGAGEPALGLPPPEDIIPVGLVARYVSLFEEQRPGQSNAAMFPSEGSSWPSSSAGTEQGTLASSAPGASTGLEAVPSAVAEAVPLQPFKRPAGEIGVSTADMPPTSHPLVVRQGELVKPELGGIFGQLLARVGQLRLSRQGTMVSGKKDVAHPATIAAAEDETSSPASDEPAIEIGSHLVSHFDQWQALLHRQAGATVDEEEPTSKPGGDQRPRGGLKASSLGSIVLIAGRPLLPAGAGGTCVTIYDKEPTSLVSYFLSTRQYYEYHAAMLADLAPHAAANLSPRAAADEDLRVMTSPLQLDCQMLADDASTNYPANRAHFQMTAYYAPQFAALRRKYVHGGEAAFLASISRCSTWASQGGKSSVYFAKTRDDRYVVKQLSRSERQSFLGFAPDYFRYLSEALSSQRDTALSKVVGVYQVSVQYPSGKLPPFGGREGVMDLLVMENLFYGRTIHRIYDLKGSSRDRYVASGAAETVGLPVLLDDNLRELNQTSPTLVAPIAYEHLQRALWADTGFLATLGVMDYSLLVGFDRDRHELVVGVIDYIRQYTWDKQVESWVKKSGILGGAGKEPTVVTPRQYSRRFRAAMLSYFTAVPSLEAPQELLNPDST